MRLDSELALQLEKNGLALQLAIVASFLVSLFSLVPFLVLQVSEAPEASIIFLLSI